MYIFDVEHETGTNATLFIIPIVKVWWIRFYECLVVRNKVTNTPSIIQNFLTPRRIKLRMASSDPFLALSLNGWDSRNLPLRCPLSGIVKGCNRPEAVAG